MDPEYLANDICRNCRVEEKEGTVLPLIKKMKGTPKGLLLQAHRVAVFAEHRWPQ